MSFDKPQLVREMRLLTAGEAENVPLRFRRVFLPLPAHRLALRSEIVVVRGGRGAGKSALFRVVQDLPGIVERRDFFEDPMLPDAVWLDAFSQGKVEHPNEAVLDRFATSVGTDQLRAFWMGHLLRRLWGGGEIEVEVPASVKRAWDRHGQDVAGWVPVVLESLGAVSRALDQAHEALAEKQRLVFAAYDHLDRIGSFNPEVRRRCIGALLALWLSFANRYSRLRAKIFLREDLFSAGEQSFPDASKLRARSVAIDWDVESLYRVVVRYMAEASEGLRSWLAPLQSRGLCFSDRSEFGWMPGSMPESTQRAFATRLAGETMGKGPNKGYTYRWIPNHLQDAQRRIVPRSILNLVGFAALAAKPQAAGARLLRTQDLVSALTQTSVQRVTEIREEYKLVERLENLRGMQVLLEPEVAVAQLAKPVPGDESEGKNLSGEDVLDELVRLGVLSIRTDGRIDVPDIYRSGFGIKRKGGAPRAR